MLPTNLLAAVLRLSNFITGATAVAFDQRLASSVPSSSVASVIVPPPGKTLLAGAIPTTAILNTGEFQDALDKAAPGVKQAVEVLNNAAIEGQQGPVKYVTPK